jgi:TctA family transporter
MLIPSFSSSQAALLVSKIKSKLGASEYIPLFSAITVSSIIFSLFLGIFFYKSRLGFVNILIANISSIKSVNIYLFLAVIIFSICVAILLVLLSIDKIIILINKINYKLLNLIVIIISTSIIFIISNWIGLVFLLISCLVGYLPLIFNKSRVVLMSYIIIPTLIYYIL